MTIGERMKALRKQKGISADSIAEKIGVSRSTIFRYEKGDIEKVPITVVAQIADILGEKPQTLMGLKPEPLPDEINKVVKQLHNDRQHNVLNYAQNQLTEQNEIHDDD